MAREIRVQEGEVRITAHQADDGIAVFRDGQKILHVDFLQNGSAAFHLAKGQSVDIRLEVYNLTGGTYNAGIFVTAGTQRVYEAHPRGFTPPLWNVAWQDTFILTAV
jgi:hypothetical protein